LLSGARRCSGFLSNAVSLSLTDLERKAVKTLRRQAVKMERQQEGSEVTTKVTVRMPVDLVKALKHMAIDEGRTFQDLVTEAVRRFLGR
jgi:predicted DNA binding CopG/RHH family protein